MSEFTPGPWRQGNTVELLLNTKCREIIFNDGNIGLVYGIIDQDNKANANLIAAAPELYEACDECLHALRTLIVHGELSDGSIDHLEKKLNAALDKADGEPKARGK